jgi:ABC-type Mn2+/Zn2+ transport system permease subunit
MNHQNEILSALLFYKAQIFTGALIGVLTALLGVFVILRRMIFSGIALSQAASAAVVLTLLFQLHSEPVVFVISLLLFSPFYYLQQKTDRYPDAVFAGALVFFAALGQVLLAISAGAQSHLITAFFGNILTMPEDEWKHLWLPVTLGSAGFAYLYRPLLAVSFDRIYAKNSGLHPALIELLFFLLLTACLTTAIYLMGSFYSIAHLVIPGLIALAFARSMKSAFALSALISLVGTITGFVISLTPIEAGEMTINLPTSSTIVMVLAAFLPLLLVSD